MFCTVTNNAHKSNKLLLARSKTRVFILKTPRGIVVVNSYTKTSKVVSITYRTCQSEVL